MRKFIKYFSIAIFALSMVVYLIIESYAYSYEFENQELESEIKEFEQERSEMFIQITEMNSRESVVEEYPELQLYDNIYYLQEVENE